METKSLVNHAETVKRALINDETLEHEVREGLINLIELTITKITVQDLLLDMKPDSIAPVKVSYCNSCKFWDNQKIYNTGKCNSPKIREKGIVTTANFIKTHEYYGCRYHESKY